MVDPELNAVFEGRWRSSLGGQFGVSWAAYERFFAEECQLELPDQYTHKGKAFARLVSSCGWVWPHKEFAIMTDRPKGISLQNGRLHNPEKPAVEFRDRWSIYALQGVSVPPEWI